MATISGQVFVDLNANGLLSTAAGETALPGVQVFLDLNADGLLDQNGFAIEPDDFAENEVLNRVSQSIFPSATGVNNQPARRVTANHHPSATTGVKVFGVEGVAAWTNSSRLRMDFTVPAGSVAIDVLGAAPSIAVVGRLDLFNRDGDLLASVATSPLASGFSKTLSLQRPQRDIAYAVAYVPENNAGSASFDNLRVDDSGSEPWTVSKTSGGYVFENVAPGTYRVMQVVPTAYEQVFPVGGAHVVPVGQSASSINFGNQTSEISGFVFRDFGTVGKYEPAGPDVPIHGATVFIDRNANGVLDGKSLSIEPDHFVEDEVLEHVSRDITLSVAGGSGRRVTASSDPLVVPTGRVFANDEFSYWNSEQKLRADFASPASQVQIDFIGGSETGSERGILEAYSADGRLLAIQVSDFMELGQRQTITLSRAIPEIAYAVAYTLDPEGGFGRLDSLRATGVAEPTATTDASGEYAFTPLEAGDYQVGLVVSASDGITLPSNDFYAVSVVVGDIIDGRHFGIVTLNQAPTANADSAVTLEDMPVSVDVLANDEDVDGSLNPNSVTIVVPPAHGVAAVEPDGLISYQPSADFFGTDSIQYTVEDNNGVSSIPATVTIEVQTVNDPPVARDDVVSVPRDGPTVIEVLGNDVDVDGSLAGETLVITQPPAHGTAEAAANGTITYTPEAGYVGTDTLRYTISDESGLVSNEALVTINVAGTAVPPVAHADEATTPEGTAVTIHVVWNDTDADGVVDTESVALTMSPDHGAASVDPVSGDILYVPQLGYVGTDTLFYTVRDNDDLLSNPGSVTITIEERMAPWQNPRNPLDTDADGSIVPLDALLVINELNSEQYSDPASGELQTRPVPPNPAPVYLDVNGDNFVSPSDALQVINFLNSVALSGAVNAEGEDSPSDALNASVFRGDDVLGDAEEQEQMVSESESSRSATVSDAVEHAQPVEVDMVISPAEMRDGASHSAGASSTNPVELDDDLLQLLAKAHMVRRMVR